MWDCTETSEGQLQNTLVSWGAGDIFPKSPWWVGNVFKLPKKCSNFFVDFKLNSKKNCRCNVFEFFILLYSIILGQTFGFFLTRSYMV